MIDGAGLSLSARHWCVVLLLAVGAHVAALWWLMPSPSPAPVLASGGPGLMLTLSTGTGAGGGGGGPTVREPASSRSPAVAPRRHHKQTGDHNARQKPRHQPRDKPRDKQRERKPDKTGQVVERPVRPAVTDAPSPAVSAASPSATVPHQGPLAASGAQSAPGPGSGQAAGDGQPQGDGRLAGGGSNSGAGDDHRGRYAALLQAWLAKHKEYPRLARMRRSEGTALLEFRVTRNGQVIAHKIRRSTGDPLLDRELSLMLARAQPLPRIPAEISGEALEVVVPIVFNMR